jgi:hypothetical protein
VQIPCSKLLLFDAIEEVDRTNTADLSDAKSSAPSAPHGRLALARATPMVKAPTVAMRPSKARLESRLLHFQATAPDGISDIVDYHKMQAQVLQPPHGMLEAGCRQKVGRIRLSVFSSPTRIRSSSSETLCLGSRRSRMA